MRLTFRQTHLYRFVNLAEMERFELSRRFEPTYRISSLLCNCDGGVRFGVVSVSPVPAESRLKSGFFVRKALRDRLF